MFIRIQLLPAWRSLLYRLWVLFNPRKVRAIEEENARIAALPPVKCVLWKQGVAFVRPVKAPAPLKICYPVWPENWMLQTIDNVFRGVPAPKFGQEFFVLRYIRDDGVAVYLHEAEIEAPVGLDTLPRKTAG
jgi:hypothetical protein